MNDEQTPYGEPAIMETDMSDDIGALAGALAAAQGEMSNAHLDQENTWYSTTERKAKYASLAEIRDTVVPALSKNELALMQLPFTERPADGPTIVGAVTMLAHSSGQWIRCRVGFRPGKKKKDGGMEYLDEPHSGGSAISYARRYGAAAVVFIAAEDDDDGNNASGGEKPGSKSTTPPQTPPKTTPKAKVEPPASASDEQRKEVVSLFSSLGLSDGQKANALVKYKITSLEKMTAASAEAILAPMRKAKAKKDAEAPKLDRTQMDAALGVLAGVVEQLAVTEEQRDAMVQKIYGQQTLAELNPQEIIEVMDALGNQYGGSDA